MLYEKIIVNSGRGLEITTYWVNHNARKFKSLAVLAPAKK
jgi:hypothetical protein